MWEGEKSEGVGRVNKKLTGMRGVATATATATPVSTCYGSSVSGYTKVKPCTFLKHHDNTRSNDSEGIFPSVIMSVIRQLSAEFC